MGGPEIIIPVVAIVCIFGLPFWGYHQRRMMEMKLKMGQKAEGNVVSELQALRQEMAELRDTTTRYDMSFDAALQRIESRVGHLEGRVNSIEGSDTRQITQDAR